MTEEQDDYSGSPFAAAKPFLTEQDYQERDPWWEARELSSIHRGDPVVNQISSLYRSFLPEADQRFGTADTPMTVDLNSYRPNVNVELLIDQGVCVFMLRVICPGRWEYGNWQYFTDTTFTAYHKRIRDYAKAKGKNVWIVGYGVHNPWMDEEANYNSPTDPQVRLLKEATRNHLCDMYSWDDEVAECWKNGANTVMTATNLVKSVSRCMEQTYQQFERNSNGSFKMPLHYSANWYMKKYALTGYQTWLDNNNRSVDTRHFLTWRAWIPLVISAAYPEIRQVFDQFISPTGLQENNYLRMGSELAADFWQGTFTATGPWCPKKADGTYAFGIDASTGYGPSNTLDKMIYNANLQVAPAGDTQPPSAPGGPLVVKLVDNTYLQLNWSAATDNVGVATYRVFRNGTVIASVNAVSYNDMTVTWNATTAYEVRAVDASGNMGPGITASITLPAEPTEPLPGEFVTHEEFDRHVHQSNPPIIPQG